MQNAFREVCSQEGFDDHLEATLDRISAIESLGRTRELTIKDLWNKGSYGITTQDHKGNVVRTAVFEVNSKEEES
jgi:predicted hotdog family 3-hydroxylacyl-ACP dehydratase